MTSETRVIHASGGDTIIAKHIDSAIAELSEGRDVLTVAVTPTRETHLTTFDASPTASVDGLLVTVVSAPAPG